jgi:hypothetical protein
MPALRFWFVGLKSLRLHVLHVDHQVGLLPAERAGIEGSVLNEP